MTGNGLSGLTGGMLSNYGTGLANRSWLDSLIDTDFSNSGNGFLGLSADNWGSIGSGLGGIMQGVSELANAYMGMKNFQLAQDQFNFSKGLANRNLANQAKVINNSYDNAAQVAAGMIGGTDSSGRYGMTDQAIVDRYARNARDKHVDGSAIG